MAEDLVEGWTEPIDQQLLADGASFNASGMTLALILRDRDGGLVDTTNKTSWQAESTSVARFSPAVGDLKASGSPYEARWKVTAGGKDAFFPNGPVDLWTVRK